MRPQKSVVVAARCVLIDSLEPRRLYTVTAGVSYGLLVVSGDYKGTEIVIDHKGANTLVNGQAFSDSLIPKGVAVYPNLSTFGHSDAWDTVSVLATDKPVEVFAEAAPYFADAKLFVGISNKGDASTIKGTVRVHGNGETTVFVDDSLSKVNRDVAVDYVPQTGITLIAGVTPAPVLLEGTQFAAVGVRVGAGNDVITVKGTSPARSRAGTPMRMTLDAGKGGNAVVVHNTSVNTALQVSNGDGGHDSVLIGRSKLDGVLGDLSVYNSRGLSSITVDDQDGDARDWTVGNGQVTSGKSGAAANFHLAFDPARVDALNVLGSIRGTAGNAYTVNDTLHPRADGKTGDVTIDGGIEPDTVRVAATNGPLNFYGINDVDTVIVGNAQHSTANVKGIVTLGVGYRLNLYVDNSAATTNQQVRVNAGGQLPLASITGMAPATIRYEDKGLSELKLWTGSGMDIVRLTGTSPHSTTDIHTGAGDDYIEVGNLASSLDDVDGLLRINGSAGLDSVYFFDSGANARHTYTEATGYFRRDLDTNVFYSNVERHTLFESTHA